MAHGYDMVFYFCLFEIPGLGKHVIRANGSANQKEVAGHIKQIHPQMNILDLHPLKNMQEIEDAAAALAADPTWMPITSEQLKQSANEAKQAISDDIPATHPAL